MRVGYAEGKLQGDWAVFAKIAGYFVYRVPPEDREDFLHDLLVEMDKVKAKYAAREKPLTEASLMMVAKYELKDYWEKRRYRLFGLNCYRCTIEQRRECQATKEPSECPKKRARRIVSLNKIMGDGDGLTELGDLIADDKPIDLAAKLDARYILQRLPKRVVQIGYKSSAGFTLETEEKEYLKLWRRVHLDERILELLRKKPQGVSRRDLSTRLQVPVGELKWNLNQLIERQQAIAVIRENTRGRPPSPLLFIAGAEIAEEKVVKIERDDRIRQAYFIEGWSIKQIKRELHHDKRTIRRAIQKVEQPALFDFK
jgi:hypothetical protein